MIRFLKFAHLIGLTIFLGSILTFIVVSASIEGASLENVAFGRKIVSTGTNALTLPGMWILAIAGVWMGLKRYGPQRKFFQIKLSIAVLVVVNAYGFVAPAVRLATALAADSLAQGQLLPAYKAAYAKESIFGAMNVLLVVAASVVGVWRMRVKDRSERLATLSIQTCE